MRLVITCLMLIGSFATGCRNYDTPRTLRGSERPDNPYFTIEEQERRSRARYAIGEDDFRVGPRTFSDRPDPVGGGVGR